jgi:hypothetical protein
MKDKNNDNSNKKDDIKINKENRKIISLNTKDKYKEKEREKTSAHKNIMNNSSFNKGKSMVNNHSSNKGKSMINNHTNKNPNLNSNKNSFTKKRDDHNTIKLSNHSTLLTKENNSNYNNRNNNNLPSASDKIKKLLEQRKVGPDGKRIHKNTEDDLEERERKAFVHGDIKNNKNKKTIKKYARYDYEDYDIYEDSFIDDREENEESKDEVDKYLSGLRKHREKLIKDEASDDIQVADYDTIEKEEKMTGLIGRIIDKNELKKIKEAKEKEGDDDDDDYDENGFVY